MTKLPPPRPGVECPFCGSCFAPEEAQSVCKACSGEERCLPLGPLPKTCAQTCPRCGYAVFGAQAPAAPTPPAPPAAPLPLTQCPLQQNLRVVALNADEHNLRKLLTLGILPGIQLQLERRSPCYLCKVGRAQLALDEKLAGCVEVVFG